MGVVVIKLKNLEEGLLKNHYLAQIMKIQKLNMVQLLDIQKVLIILIQDTKVIPI